MDFIETGREPITAEMTHAPRALQKLAVDLDTIAVAGDTQSRGNNEDILCDHLYGGH